MHKYVQMTILILIPFLKKKIYFFPLIFSEENIWYEQDQPQVNFSRGKFLGVSRSNFSIFWSMRRSLTRE